jgi:acetylornithine deacetylase
VPRAGGAFAFMDLFELTRALVALETPTGSEKPAIDLLDGLLRGAGYRVVRQPVSAGRDNLYAYRDRPEVVFSTHVDTVPPYVPLREDEDTLHGRGVCDAKGIAAAMITAAARMRARGEERIGLLFLVGEENGSDGARAAADFGPRGRYLINGEPTENLLSVGQKGSLRVTLTATGRSAHSGYPDEGISATEALLDTLERIRRLPLPSDPVLGPSTLNIGTLDGGVAPNVIPAEASAQLLFRTVTPTTELRCAVEAAAAPGVRVTFGLELPYHKGGVVPPGWQTTVVSFGSDLPFLGSWCDCYQLGPGSIRVAHSDAEYIRKDDLLRGVELYVRLATDLLAGEAA